MPLSEETPQLIGRKKLPTDRFVLVDGDDWMGLYVDGALMAEGHTISSSALAAACGIPLVTVVCNDQWLVERGGFPSFLSEVVL